MRAVFTILFVGTIVLGVGAWSGVAAQKRKPAQPQRRPKDPTAEILRLEGEMMKAIRLKDAAALGRILSEDFVLRTPGHPEVGKADFIKGVASIPLPMVDVRGDELGISIYGDLVVLTGIQRVITKDDAGKPETSASAFTDIFIKRGGRWWLVMAHGVDLPAPAH